ncbi:hypothetical protein Tco_1419734 [Tanacetum coccineum]
MRHLRIAKVSDCDAILDPYTMQALKEIKKTSRRQPGIGGSREGTGRIPKVPDEFTVVSATSHEGSSTKPGVLDEEKVISEKKDIKMLMLTTKAYDHISDSQGSNDEDAETELMKMISYINFVWPKQMLKRLKKLKDDAKKAELPSTSSRLFVASDTTDVEINSFIGF